MHVFAPEMQRGDPALGGTVVRDNRLAGLMTLQLLGELRSAIDNAELTLVYQPKFDLRDHSIAGVEALVRWPHPEHGLLEPKEFLPLVREHGLMQSMTEALDQAVRWRDQGILVPIAVNLFAPSLGDLTLPGRTVAALQSRELRSDTLTVEVTEDFILDGRARTVITQLRESGVRVAIDDFGSGYSALAYLRDLDIDELKLDREFISAMPSDCRADLIVRTVIDLAHKLRLTTVAEGIEDLETASRLQEYGCQQAQGHFYSPPLTPPEMLAMLHSASCL